MSDALKKIVEAIDSRDVSAIAENFPAAIKAKILARINEESTKAFDKGVEKIEGDGESDADGEDEDDDGKKKVREAYGPRKTVILTFANEKMFDAFVGDFEAGGTFINKDRKNLQIELDKDKSNSWLTASINRGRWVKSEIGTAS